MKYRILNKYAQNNLSFTFIRGWKDSDGNVCAVFDVSGKKYGFLKLASNDRWHYWMGIGSDKITKQMPAGRGDYLIGTPLELEISKKLSELIEKNINLEPLITAGASWAPTDDSQLSSLSNLVNKSAEINNFLSQNGILYTGSDKVIFGENITGQDILSSQINRSITKKVEIPLGSSSNESERNKDTSSVERKTDISARSKEDKPQEKTTGNTPNTEKFIQEIKKSYKEKFGKELHIGSTFRSPLDQARAMRDPLGVGDYDRLYGREEKAAEVKRLISTKKDEDLKRAAEIVATMDISPHMSGRGIDIPFRKNDFSGRDYNLFSKFISEVSQRTGIGAKLNSEKKTHFHITVSR